jgi:dihydrofolate reductase/thymidylate synthase
MTDIAAVVAAATGSRGIGKDGNLVWRLPDDMAHFKHVTTIPPSLSSSQTNLVNAVIMGRKTWESIPPKFRPLTGRTNVILTRQDNYEIKKNAQEEQDQILIAKSLKEATEQLRTLSNLGQIFIIGGGEIYKESIESGLVNRVIYTEVMELPSSMDVSFDAFFPELDSTNWDCVPFYKDETAKIEQNHIEEKKQDSDRSDVSTNEAVIHIDAKTGTKYRFLEYTRKKSPMRNDTAMAMVAEGAHVNPEEMQYLDMCREIMNHGVQRGDRTGTGTLSKFGTQMRFSLRDNTLPLLTTKRTFWRGVAEELLWFIQGNTNANDLTSKNIHIWDGNGSREFLDSRGLNHREVGDLGPVYGFQWRHFGAKYVDMHTDYTGQGVDQLAECIEKIKNNPEDRRIIMSAWNPADLEEMALPPCHMFCQFYVDTKNNELSCQMYQRSADMGLGVPFNIASYALLTHMIAHVTGRKPGDFVHTIGDAHVYLNHVDALKEQLERPPRAFPKLKINSEKKNIDDFVFDDFEVIGYEPHKAISMKMAV